METKSTHYNQDKITHSLRAVILKSVAQYSSATGLAIGLGLIASFLSAALLGPALYGIWMAVRLILIYIPALEFGVLDGAYRNLPFLRGKGEAIGTVNAIKNTCGIFVIFLGLVCAIGIWFASFFPVFDQVSAHALKFVALTGGFFLLERYCTIILKTENRFAEVSIITALKPTIIFIGAISIFWFGFEGLLYGTLLASMITAIYGLYCIRFFPKIRDSLTSLLPLMKIGMPIMLVSLAQRFFMTSDRIVILGLIGTTQLGYYGIGTSITRLVVVAQMAWPVLYPRMTEEFGKTGDAASLKKYIGAPNILMALVLPVVVGIGCLALPKLIEAFLPEYIPGVKAAQVVIFGAVFWTLSGMGSYLLITIGRQVLNLIIFVSCFVVTFALQYFLVSFGLGIEGAALGTVLGNLLLTILVISIVMKYCRSSSREIAVLLLKILSPVFYVIVVLVSIQTFIKPTGWIVLIFKEILFLGVTSRLLFLAAKKLGISSYRDILGFIKSIARSTKGGKTHAS